MKQVRSSIALVCIFLGITAMLAVVANLAWAQSFSLTINKVGQGQVNVNPLPPYIENQEVTLTAVPDPGWQFVSWDAEGAQSNWWDSQWDYRVPVTVSANGTQRKNKPAEVDLDFDTFIASLGKTGTLDPNSVRVVEVDQAGDLVDADVPFQFDVKRVLNDQYDPNKFPGAVCDTEVPGSGTVTFILEGTTGANVDRFYHIYFDVTGKGIPAPTVTPQIVLTDGVVDPPNPDPGRQASYKIETASGTYYYHKLGAAFSSLDDADGNDWINYNGTFGSGFGGEYRGIPNLVLPNNGGQFHPGTKDNKLNTCLVSEGPLKATIYSIFRKTNTDRWLVTWEVYPTYANMTVLVARYDYWFLYEGTPGGSFDGNSDFIVRSDGTQTPLSQAWKTPLSPEQWVYAADPVVGRSLFAAQHGADDKQEWYDTGSGKMTVFGFGRNSGSALIPKAQVPQQFTIGLIDTTTFADAAPIIRSAYKDLQTDTGDAELRGGGGSLGTTNPVQFTVTGNNVVTATFAPAAFALNLTPDGSGSVSKNPDKATYSFGEQVVITATPSAGWGFVGWQGDVGGINPSLSPQTVTMSADRDIVAKFLPVYAVETTAIGEGVIDVTPDKAQYFSGDAITVTASPAPGWSFDGWAGGLNGVTNPQSTIVNSNLSITGTFTQDEYSLSVTSSGNGSADWSPKQPSYLYGDTVTLTATADPGYVFMGWTGTVTGSDATTQITMTGNTTATANFEAIAFYMLDTTPVGPGSATRQPDQTTYQTGTVVTLTAVPNAGAIFTGWTGDVISTANPVQVTMDGDKVVTPNFTTSGPFTLTLTKEGQGTVTKDPDKSEYDAGEIVTLSATPSPGWLFSGWQGGGLSGSANPITVTMDGDKDVKAIFAQPGTTGPATDNFDNCVLEDQWAFVNPVGDATLRFNARQLRIQVPADTEHNVFTSGNDSARVMQATENEDFVVDVKFDSKLEENGAMQGILVEQDTGTFIRFDFYKRNDIVTVYAGVFENLVSLGTYSKVTIADLDPPLYLRVSRQGDTWEMLYSFNGTAWNSAYVFDHVIEVRKVGIFAGNFKVRGAVPAHTAVADYFYNAADPAKPADQSLLTVNIIGNGQVQRTPAAPYTCGQTVTLTAAPNSGAQFAGWTGDATGTQSPLPVVLNTRKTVTATFTGGTTTFNLALPVVIKP